MSTVEIDPVADYLKSVSKDNKGDPKLRKAIDAHNDFKEKFKKYKMFYDDHQRDVGGKEIPTSSKDAPKAHEKLRAEIDQLKFEKENMRKQIEELRTRLSTLAGQKMIEGNPDVADLSDPFRPTKLAEDFREIYDDDWTHAFEELDSDSKSESQVIDLLTNLIREIYTFCTKYSTQQVITMETACTDELVNPKVNIEKVGEVCGKSPSVMNNTQKDATNRMISDLRKSMGILSVRPLVQIFHEKWLMKMKQENKLPTTSRQTEQFVEKAFKVIWLMTIQSPPMAFKWQKKDEQFDKDKFTFYTKRGAIIQQTVWPAVLLHEAGPLMSKGVAQAQ